MGEKNEWKITKVSNLVRRNESTYYAQLKVSGKTYRRSLGTAKYAVAKLKLSGKLDEIRTSAEDAAAVSGGGFDTFRDCLEEWLMIEKSRPHLKASTQEYNDRRFGDLIRMLPVDDAVGKVGDKVLREWWMRAASDYNPQYANNLLSVVRVIVSMQVTAGLRRKNIALDFKRMPIARTIKDLPSGEEMTLIINEVRSQKKRASEESADLIAWMAYTGMRPTEARKMKWKDVGEDFLIVRQGKFGTKNYKERKVPIMSALREVVDRRRQDSGDLWSIKNPRLALGAACKRLQLQHVARYDLRHFFATRCLESGVDAATVGKWLGHSDGGALVMRTYGHVSDTHGLEVSKKVSLE